MQIATNVTLSRLPDRDGTRSVVLISNQSVGTEVAGCVLEAAVECTPGWLLFVTDDTPDEQMLAIHLLDRGGHLVDSAQIGGPYTTGTFTDLRLEPPSVVHFRFIDDADWSVEVLDRPHFSVPWLPDAKGVWRSGQFTRQMTVRRR
jgi:hypothetical protein